MAFAMAIALLLAAAADREPPRKVLKAQSCGKCHDSAVSTENRDALAVYDLREDDWPRRMTDKQLPKLMGRLKSAPAADRKIVQQFIEAELKARRPNQAGQSF